MNLEENAIEILNLLCGNSGCVISDSGGKDEWGNVFEEYSNDDTRFKGGLA